ncbi:hypothetical protein QRX50_01065 [Amycolatopsis carbonis]|uniref:Uncharacterized protein n=1 Tax=Amycolatopsis carbonis TaxID=715471 RepID=A0A9Y2IGC6_9PSEU|nr:hypothetical protein [Amycolatopsis sp. 2-15]WIX79439.1 hypothetical protein QRX50_01065 [Amycolatopsis sp. 2-15]
MKPLELRYRRLTRVLPAHYRRAWEDDMVSTFVESTTAHSDDPEFELDYGRPDARETASVLALAVRLRLSDQGPRRYALAGEAVRRLALTGTVFQAALALITGILRLTWPPPLVREAPTATLVLELLWLPALAALLAGRRKIAGVFALAATAGTFLSLPSSWGGIVLEVATLAAIAAYPKPATVHTRQWLAATGITAVVAFAVQWLGIVNEVAVAGVLTVAAGLVLLTMTPPAARETWLAAATIVMIAVLATLPNLAGHLVPIAWGVIGALAITGTAVAIRTRRTHKAT